MWKMREGDLSFFSVPSYLFSFMSTLKPPLILFTFHSLKPIHVEHSPLLHGAALTGQVWLRYLFFSSWHHRGAVSGAPDAVLLQPGWSEIRAWAGWRRGFWLSQ